MTVVLLVFAIVNVQAQDKPEWKEMKDFHAVMSKVFHAAEKNNFVPLKEKSADLVVVAKAFKASNVPEAYKSKKLKSLMKELVKDSKAVNKAVAKNATDEVLLTKITKAHDTYHAVVGACNDKH